RQTSRLFRRSAMSTRGRQKRRYGASYDLAHGQPADRGVSPQLPYNVARDLEGDRHRGFGDHRWRGDRLSLFEIAIGLTPRQTKIARQSDSRFHHAGPPREQVLRRPHPLGSLRMGRSRHMTSSYYSLRRKSSTKSGTPIHDSPLKAEVTFCVQGVLSPLLSNVVLDVLDKELEQRGHRFVR